LACNLFYTPLIYSSESMQTPALSPEKYDFVVLGSGEAGKFLAWTLARNGKHAVVIERRYIGDSCPNIAKKERGRAGFRIRRFVGPKTTIRERNDRLAHRENLDVSEALVWSQSVILPPRHERLDVRAYASRVYVRPVELCSSIGGTSAE